MFSTRKLTVSDTKKKSDKIRGNITSGHQHDTKIIQTTKDNKTSCSKRKHKVLTLSEKSAILYRLDRGESASKLAEIFGIGKSTISDIKRNSDKIRGFISSTYHGPGTRKTLKKAKNPLVEKALYMWFVQETYKHASITSDMLAAKAKSFHEKMADNKNFIGSKGWLERFKIRHGIKLFNLASDRMTSIQTAVQRFKVRLEQIAKDLDLSPEQIYTANESSLSWQLLSTDKTTSKKKITFMICANSTGQHKLKMIVIGTPESSVSVKDCGFPVNFVEQSDAWITKNIIFRWFQDEFIPEIRIWMNGHNFSERALLLLPHAPGYPSEEELESDDKVIRTLLIPPNCTSLLQPMEQDVMQSIRTRYKRDILNKLVLQSKQNIHTNLQNVNMKDVAVMLENSWQCFSNEMIKLSWKSILPTNLNGLDSSNIQVTEIDDEDSTKLADLVKIVAENCDLTVEQIDDWINRDFDKTECHEMLDDDQIIERILSANEAKLVTSMDNIGCEVEVEEWENELCTKNEYREIVNDEPVTPEMVLTENESIEIVSSVVSRKSGEKILHKDAVTSFDICLRWAEDNNLPFHELMLLRQMKEKALSAANKDELV